MTAHHFILIIEGSDLQAEGSIDALFLAGCDDATVGRVGATQYVDFDREAETLADAVFAATADIEAAVPGTRVLHVEPDELVTMAEIAERTGRTRESVRLLINGQRGPGGFPPPATHFKSRNRMWEWQEVAAWFAEILNEQPVDGDSTRSGFIAAFNAGLRLRRTAEKLNESERRRIRELVGQQR